MGSLDERMYWSIVPFGEAQMHLAATEHGLAFVGALDGPFEEMERGVARRFNVADWVRDDERLSLYRKELSEYGTGVRSTFDSRFDLRGTPFQLNVWEALRAIPFGQTRSYSDIAAAIGSPSAVRAVGAAIGANPILVMVPCHRVVGKNGSLTGYRGGLPMKQLLLRLEQGGDDRIAGGAGGGAEGTGDHVMAEAQVVDEVHEVDVDHGVEVNQEAEASWR